MSEKEVIKNTLNGPITVESLKKDLGALGVKPGQVLLVHSSLSSIGWVSGGAVAVILALEESLGPEGTLVMPTFSGALSDPEDWSNPPVPEDWKETIRKSMPVFDPGMTPTRAMGRIPETFRNQAEARRSDHPQMSFTSRGKKTPAITGTHPLDYPLGEDSPLGSIYKLAGWILLLGVGHDNNTSLHLAEYRAKFKGKKVIKQAAPVLVEGERHWIGLKDIEEHSENFPEVGKAYLAAGGTALHGKVGQADSVLIPQRELVDFAVHWMEKNWSY